MLKIGNKTYGLLFTVRARIEISKLAGHSMQEFFDALGKDEEQSVNLLIDAVEILHNAYLRAKALDEGKEYEAVELNREEFLDLTPKAWSDVESAIIAAIKGDSETTVNTTAKKKADEKAN